MTIFTTYLEKVESVQSGIRYIENALRSLYSIQSPDEELELKTINRVIDTIVETLIKASSVFEVPQYNGIVTEQSLDENIDTAVHKLSTILNEYNDGVDDFLGWGKVCMDIVASLNYNLRRINK